MDARQLFVLQQDPDHLVQRDVGAEGELADAVAVFVGVAVLPELLLEVGARAMRSNEAALGDLQCQRRGREVALLPPEVIDGRVTCRQTTRPDRRRRSRTP